MTVSKNNRRQFPAHLAYAPAAARPPYFPQMRMIGAALANARAARLQGARLRESLGRQRLVESPDAVRHAALRRVPPQRAAACTTCGRTRPALRSLRRSTRRSRCRRSSTATMRTPRRTASFVHPSAVKLADLYRQNKLAFVVNAGPLKRPITMVDYPTGATPAALYSQVKDQTDFWHQGTRTRRRSAGWSLRRPARPRQREHHAVELHLDRRRQPLQNGVSTLPYQPSTSGLDTLSGMCNQTPCGNANTTRRDTR